MNIFMSWNIIQLRPLNSLLGPSKKDSPWNFQYQHLKTLHNWIWLVMLLVISVPAHSFPAHSVPAHSFPAHRFLITLGDYLEFGWFALARCLR